MSKAMDEIKGFIDELESGERIAVFKTNGQEIFLAGDNYNAIENWAADVLAAAFQHGLTGEDIDRMKEVTTLKAVG